MKPNSDPGVIDYSRYAEAGEITVNSPVIAAAISPPDVFPLDHVTFTLKHYEVLVYTVCWQTRICLKKKKVDKYCITVNTVLCII